MTQVRIPLKYPVVSDPDILGGTPVIKGTRIPASLIFELLRRGWHVQTIRSEYPSVSNQKLNAFLRLMSTSFDVASTKTL